MTRVAVMTDETVLESAYGLATQPSGGPISPSDISVVICAYTEERWELLCASVDSAAAAGAEQIVVVIDHNPLLVARATNCFPYATVVENHQPQGLSGARNTGLALTTRPIVGFIDDDASAAEDWLLELAEGYAADDVIAVGGLVEAVWGDAGRPRWFPREFDWVVGCSYRGLPVGLAPIRNLIGCNMSFRRELFEEVGGFVSGIGRIGVTPVGCEETELCIRASQLQPGCTILYNPAARVSHDVSPGRHSIRYFISRCFAEGRSKAQVAVAVGSSQGLGTERTYVRQTLPRGVARGLQDATKGDPWGAARAGAIVAGLAITVLGYVKGRVVDRPTSPSPAAG
jgi:GT2 family glycosyltransferase